MSEICIVCKNQIENGICPFCGYDRQAGTEPQCLQAGTELAGGKYRIGNIAGVGGFGVTYAAWHMMLQKKVAIKEYLPGEFSTRMHGVTHVTVYGGEKEEQYRNGLEKFFEESRRLAEFTEVPGIVQIYDCFKENETAYIVMEYLEGETLGERIKREGKIPVQEAVGIILPVLDALDAVHASGIVHRDIAPNNIFLTKNGGVKLLDFGAARSATGTHSKSLTVLYKEGFTAEEQYQSRGEQGSWTDVYAVAATLYKAITGITPEGAMERRVKDQLKAPSKTGVKVPGNIDTAIMNAMNVTIKKRTKTAGKFKEELLSNKAVRKHYGRTEEKKVGRVPVIVWVLSGLGIAAVITILVLLRVGVIEFRGDVFSDLFVAEGQVRMMNVVNMDLAEAKERLENIGLNLEVEEYRFDNRVQIGRIISQDTVKGTVIDKGSTVRVIVSAEAQMVTVPEIQELEQEEAIALLENLSLEYELVGQEGALPPGRILSSMPAVGDSILQGETVTVYVSEGLNYDPGAVYQVPDLTGKTITEAREQLAENGVYLLRGESIYDDNISSNLIAGQDVSEGTTIACGSIITVNISMGIEQIEVPDVTGLLVDDARDALSLVGLTALIIQEINENGTEGLVLRQGTAGGQIVDKGSEISLTVSVTGYEIPDLIGLTRTQAEQVCRDNGYTMAVSEEVIGDIGVKSQEPAAGQRVDDKGTIMVRVGIGYAIPNLSGLSRIEAEQVCRDNGFNLAVSEEVVGDFGVMNQEPAAGQIVENRGTITVLMGLGYQIPDLIGLSREEAQQVCWDNGFTLAVNEEWTGESGVKTQEPVAGQIVESRGTITVLVGVGYKVPNLIGLTRSEAELLCQESGFRLRVEQVNGGDGTVQSQSITAGEILRTSTTITVKIGVPIDYSGLSDLEEEFLRAINNQRVAEGDAPLAYSNEMEFALSEHLSGNSDEILCEHQYAWARYGSGYDGYTDAGSLIADSQGMLTYSGYTQVAFYTEDGVIKGFILR